MVLTSATAATLGGLALVDSTSFGTLSVPVVMLLQRRPRVRLLLLYLATIGAFYWTLGVALALGAAGLRDGLEVLGRTIPYPNHLQLALGVGLFAVSFLLDAKGKAWRAARRVRRDAARGIVRPAEPPGASRRHRWEARLVGEHATPAVVVGLALAAGLVEAASMLPYLGAIGILTQERLRLPATAAVLVAYVLVMTLPALLLLVLRLVARRAVEPVLLRLRRWMERNADDMLSWILGIVGFFVAADAASRLMAAA